MKETENKITSANGTGIDRLKYIISLAILGTGGMFLRFVNVPSEIVVLCRGSIGALFLYIFTRLQGRRPDREAIRANLGKLIISGMFVGVNWILLFTAYEITSVAVASLCNHMAHIFLIIAAPLILKEKINPRKLPCVAVAMVGIVLVSGVLGGKLAPNDLKGVIFGLLAAVCFTGNVICNRKFSPMVPLDKSMTQLGIAALTILPYVLIKDGGADIHFDTRSIIVILIMCLVHTGFAYVLYYGALPKLPVQSVAILGYLEPVVAVFCSAVFLKEAMSTAAWIGAVLIIGAAVTSELIPDKKN